VITQRIPATSREVSEKEGNKRSGWKVASNVRSVALATGIQIPEVRLEVFWVFVYGFIFSGHV
jgi:hypothetical protein